MKTIDYFKDIDFVQYDGLKEDVNRVFDVWVDNLISIGFKSLFWASVIEDTCLVLFYIGAKGFSTAELGLYWLYLFAPFLEYVISCRESLELVIFTCLYEEFGQ